MTTLREKLDALDRFRQEYVCSYRAGHAEKCDCKYRFKGSSEETGCPELRDLIAEIENFIYGKEEECEAKDCDRAGFYCIVHGWHTTEACFGGKPREPGLVERIRDGALQANREAQGNGALLAGQVLDLLRQEIGG